MKMLSKILGISILSSLLAGCAVNSDAQHSSNVGITPIEETPNWVAVWGGYGEQGRAHVMTRLAQIEALEPMNGGALFIGDSITEAAPVQELFPEIDTRNYGIGWDNTDGILLRLSQIKRNQPKRIFLKIGTNNLSAGHSPQHISDQVGQIISKLKSDLPQTEMYVMSILPRSADWSESVIATNKLIEDKTIQSGATFLNIYPHFEDGRGGLIAAYTEDQLHLNEAGYGQYQNVLKDCVINGCDAIK